jgi:hypothetical protein
MAYAPQGATGVKENTLCNKCASYVYIRENQVQPKIA